MTLMDTPSHLAQFTSQLEAIEERVNSDKSLPSHTRRLLLGGVLGLVGGAGALLSAREAQAAPADVRGSSGVAIAAYSNREGTFVVWSDGCLSNSTGAWVATTPANYPLWDKYRKPTIAAGKTKGSPHVCTGYVQNREGTFLLFADGTLRVPPVGNKPASGELRYMTFSTKWQHSATLLTQAGTSSEGLTMTKIGSQGFKLAFEEPFAELPLVCYAAEVHEGIGAGGASAGGTATGANYADLNMNSFYVLNESGGSVTKESATVPGATPIMGFVIGM